MNPWYIYNKNQRKKYGPYSSDQLKTMIQKRNIDNSCAISSDGVTWYSANEMANQFANLQPQKKIGKFEIIKELGRGGMGVVYHARDIYLQYECAVKFIRLDQGVNDNTTKRFITEAQSIAKLNHPNIIKIKELNNCADAQGNNLYYFSMDYIKGISFKEYMNKEVPLKQKLEMLHQICEGVAYAHQHKIIHRDLKPQNIIVSDQGVPIILDFGLARNLDKTDDVTKTGDIIGTPKYIAPEIMRGEKADEKCDVYALGVILYEILTGFSPFGGENIIEVLFQVSHTNPIPPSKANNNIKKDSSIEIICLKCLEKKPNDRIDSVAFLCEELKCIIDGKPTKTKPPGFLSRTIIRIFENPKIVLAVMILLIVSFLGLWTYTNNSHQNEIQNQQVKIQNQQAKIQNQKVGVLNSEAANQNAMQFYEKFSQPKGMNSVISGIEKQYLDLENYIENNYHNALLSQKQKVLNFLNNTQIIMKYFILPSIPKIKHNIELQNTLNIVQIKISSTNYIAILDDKQNLFLSDINQTSKKVLLDKPLATRCRKFFFSADGKWLATLEFDNNNSRQNVCRLYNIKQKKLILTKQVNNEAKLSLAFSPNSKYLAYNDFINGVSIVSIKSNEIISTFKSEGAAVYFSFSPDNKHLVSRADKTYSIYNIEQHSYHKPILYHTRHPIWISSHELAFFTASYLEIYNLKAKKFSKHAFDKFPQDNLITNAISPDKKTLMWGTKNGYINYFHVLDKKAERKKQSPANINHIEFINNHLFFTQDAANFFYLRDLSSKEIVYRKPNVIYAKKINNEIVVVVEENGKLLIKYWHTPYLLKQILKPNKETSKIINLVLEKFTDNFTSKNCIFIKKNNDLKTVILPLYKGFSIWKKQERGYQNILKTNLLCDIWNTQVSNDQKWFASILHHKKLRKQQVILIESDKILQLDLRGGKKIIDGKKVHGRYLDKWINNEDYNTAEIRVLDFMPNNDLLFSYANEVWQYSISKKSVKKITKVRSKVCNIEIHHKLNIVAIGQRNNQLDLISANGKVIFQPKFKESKGNIKKISWHPTLPICAVINDQEQLYLLNKKNSIWSFEKIDIPGNKSNISFSPNDDVLAIFTIGETYIYSLKTKSYVPIFPGYYKNRGANFSYDWQYAAFPSENTDILLFDLRKLNFSYFPEYFATKKPLQSQKEDAIWPHRIRKKFLNYIDSK